MEEEEVIWWHGVAAHGMSFYFARYFGFGVSVCRRVVPHGERESRDERRRERESMHAVWRNVEQESGCS